MCSNWPVGIKICPSFSAHLFLCTFHFFVLSWRVVSFPNFYASPLFVHIFSVILLPATLFAIFLRYLRRLSMASLVRRWNPEWLSNRAIQLTKTRIKMVLHSLIKLPWFPIRTTNNLSSCICRQKKREEKSSLLCNCSYKPHRACRTATWCCCSALGSPSTRLGPHPGRGRNPSHASSELLSIVSVQRGVTPNKNDQSPSESHFHFRSSVTNSDFLLDNVCIIGYRDYVFSGDREWWYLGSCWRSGILDSNLYLWWFHVADSCGGNYPGNAWRIPPSLSNRSYFFIDT